MSEVCFLDKQMDSRCFSGGTCIRGFLCCSSVVRAKRIIADATTNRAWIEDSKGQINIHTFHQVLSLWKFIYDSPTLPGVGDEWTWAWNPKGFFSTKSVYSAHFSAMIECSTTCTIWKTWALLKCKKILWLVIRGRVWTTDCLAKRGFPHYDSCFFCSSDHETVQHLFTGCSIISILWSLIMQWANLGEVVPSAFLPIRDW